METEKKELTALEKAKKAGKALIKGALTSFGNGCDKIQNVIALCSEIAYDHGDTSLLNELIGPKFKSVDRATIRKYVVEKLPVECIKDQKGHLHFVVSKVKIAAMKDRKVTGTILRSRLCIEKGNQEGKIDPWYTYSPEQMPGPLDTVKILTGLANNLAKAEEKKHRKVKVPDTADTIAAMDAMINGLNAHRLAAGFDAMPTVSEIQSRLAKVDGYYDLTSNTKIVA